jgi:hypothetical protein
MNIYINIYIYMYIPATTHSADWFLSPSADGFLVPTADTSSGIIKKKQIQPNCRQINYMS